MQIYKVGGAVRDHLLGRPVTETDWVVVGASAEELTSQGFRPVGADFPVFLHPETGEEYALARTERKSGRGYGGFTFHAHPDVTLEQDLMRRDLTINAMAEDAQGRLIDPYGGRADLEARRLRHVSPAFAEDPLRVLRVARFAARYADLGFHVADDTLALMRQLAESGELQALTPERVWKEMCRALMEPAPDVFLEVLHSCGALAVLLPEVATLFGAAPVTAPALDMENAGGHLLRVLHQCARHGQPLTIRWACLLHRLGEHDGAVSTPEQAPTSTALALIRQVNARCKPPRDCQELALLVGQYHTLCDRAPALPPDALLALLQPFDVYRRPERLTAFIAACAMAARGRPGHEDEPYLPGIYLQGAADAVRAVTTAHLLEQGYRGAELGVALARERLVALTAYVQRHAERGTNATYR